MTSSEPAPVVGGIVLAGGSGSRLGADKASIDWHGTPLVERVARLLERGLGGGPVAIVGPHGDAPAVEGFVGTCDRFADAGPLAGLSAGMAALGAGIDAAVAVPCDVPLLHPAVVRALASALLGGDADVACPAGGDGMPHPFPGAWRVALGPRIVEAVEHSELSPRRLALEAGFAAVDLSSDPEVAEADPKLDSLRDIDLPADLERLLESPPKVRVARDGRIATIAAWTLGEAAHSTGGDPEGPCVLNGLPVEFAPQLPLARRDAISLPPAAV